MQVIVKLAIEATKHDKCLAHKYAREPPPWLWNRVTDLDLLPARRPNVEAVNIIYVLVIPAAKDKKLVAVHNRGSVAPTSAGHVLAGQHFGANY